MCKIVKMLIGPWIVLLLLMINCYHSNSVSLQIDFKNSNNWHYLLFIIIKGTVGTPDTQHEFTSSTRMYLDGVRSANNTSTVRLRTKETRIESNFLGDVDRTNLEHQFNGMELSFSPNDGALHMPDSAPAPIVMIGGWDLFRSFTKVLPILPGRSVSPGFTWDRQRDLPIETTQGSAVGHLYQAFTFDSISASGNSTPLAYISWVFSYKIEIKNPESGTVFDRIPMEGTGKGDAIIDFTQKCLLKANAQFDVPVADHNQVRTGWSETVHLEMIK